MGELQLIGTGLTSLLYCAWKDSFTLRKWSCFLANKSLAINSIGKHMESGKLPTGIYLPQVSMINLYSEVTSLWHVECGLGRVSIPCSYAKMHS